MSGKGVGSFGGSTTGLSSGEKSPRKLTAEELNRSATRLTTSTRPVVTLKPIVEPTRLSKEQEDKSIKRLYDEAIQHKKRTDEELHKRHEEATSPSHLAHTKVLATSDEQEAISRLYEKTIDQRHMLEEELKKKYCSPKKNDKLEPGRQGEVNQRLYGDSIGKHRDGQTKLYEKYILDVEPKAAKRTKAELKINATRLHAGER